MAIVIPKKKLTQAEPVEPPVALLSEFADQIDLVGRLQAEAEPILKQIKELQAKLKPLKDAEKKLQESLDAIDAADDAEGMTEIGAQYSVEIGKKGAARKVKDMLKVYKLMGKELFFKVVQVALKDIDAYLTQPQRDEVLETSRTSRSYKLTKRT
jgi:hypothetical protein